MRKNRDSTITNEELEVLIAHVISDAFKEEGEGTMPTISGQTNILDEMEGFDSLTGVSMTLQIQEELEAKCGIKKNLGTTVFQRKLRRFTLDEVIDRVQELLKKKKK